MALHEKSTRNSNASSPNDMKEDMDTAVLIKNGSLSKIRINSLLPGILRIILLVVLVIAVSALAFSLETLMQALGIGIRPEFVDFTLVILLGMLVGFIEIVSRYQDAPFRTALTWPGLFYMLINGLVAGSAL
jgi:hypothetical protein